MKRTVYISSNLADRIRDHLQKHPDESLSIIVQQALEDQFPSNPPAQLFLSASRKIRTFLMWLFIDRQGIPDRHQSNLRFVAPRDASKLLELTGIVEDASINTSEQAEDSVEIEPPHPSSLRDTSKLLDLTGVVREMPPGAGEEDSD